MDLTIDEHNAEQILRRSNSEVLCIILSYNGREDTSHCLESILNQRVAGMDVLVIDNASSKGVVETLQAKHPEVEIVALSENLGWAGGNNVGIQIGLDRGYKWLCLLNNDIVFPEGELQKWFNSITNSSPCLLHPSIYFWSEREIAQVHPQHDGRLSAYDIDQNNRSKAVMNFAYGACLAIHQEIFEKVNVFDERFFLQLEETDFYLRAKKHGYEAVCDSSVQIFHKESRAFGGKHAPIKTYYSVRNTLLLSEKKNGDIKSKLSDFKALYWSLCNLATETEAAGHIDKFKFMKWIFSTSPSAKAIRLGANDYLFRKFGKISEDKRADLKTNEEMLTAAIAP